MMYWFQTFAVGVCYFLFNRQFFKWSGSILGTRPLRKRSVLWTFLLNYSVFFACSVLKLHLIINWGCFLLLLFVEQQILYRQSARKYFLLALLGTQLGLTANILFRSLMAVLFDLPLVVFDNQATEPGNLKAYPVLLGFLGVGVVFWLLARFHLLEGLNLVMKDRRTLVFLIGLACAMHVYLCLNLLVYDVRENDIILKLWSIKSSIFVLVGECLSVLLSIHMGQLTAYREESRKSREQLAKERERELELRVIATTDPLTGCENRAQAEIRLQDVLDTGRMFCLCFVDLDGLKSVNDSFGHEMGDRYLLSVADALGSVRGHGGFLIRYGGDEFLLLLYDVTKEVAVESLERAQRRLEEERLRQNYAFPMSISFGVATPDDGEEVSVLIKIADTRMYHMKQARHVSCDKSR